MRTNSIRLGSVAVLVVVLAAVWLLAGSELLAQNQNKVEVVSGVSFGPIVLTAEKSLQVCACNLFGDRPAEVRILYFSTTPNQSDAIPPAGERETLKPRESKCFSSISGPLQVVALLVGATANNWNSGQEWRSIIGSGIVTDSRGGAFALPAVQHINVPTPPLPSTDR